MPNIVLKQHRGSIAKVKAFVEDMAVQYPRVDSYRGWPWAVTGMANGPHSWMPKAWTLYVNGRPVAVACVLQVRTLVSSIEEGRRGFRGFIATLKPHETYSGYMGNQFSWEWGPLNDWPAESDNWIKATLTQLAEATA